MSSLAGRLAEGAAPMRVVTPNVTRDIYDTIGRVRVIGPATAQFMFDGGNAEIVIDREVRVSIEHHPDALYVADFAAGADGTLHPFQPPRSLQLTGRIPIRVPESLAAELASIGLALGVDLCQRGQALAGNAPVAVLGQRSLASLSREDAATVTWWLPNGGALDLRVITEGERAWLAVHAPIKAADARTANCGPNTLAHIERGASFPLVAADEDVPLSCLEPFRPPRPALFDAWARYALLDREERDERERSRVAKPLTFSHGRQRERNWVVQASVDVETQDAWVGSDAQDARPIRLDQTVEGFSAASGEMTSVGKYSAQTATLRGPGLLDIVLRPDRGAGPLPESGRLEARANKGEKVRRDRERDALDRLTAGRAANERLVQGLLQPETVPSAIESPLPLTPLEALDPSQMRAVRLILGCESIVAIQGPPGTGKTRVIVEALRQIEAQSKGERVRVLLSSVQNEAVGNIVERMAGGDGMLVKIVRREAKDEDEAFDYAGWLDRQRQSAVERLERMYKDADVNEKIAILREAEDEVDEIRRWAGAGPTARGFLADALAEAAKKPDGLLTSFLRDEAGQLASLLAAPESAGHSAMAASVQWEARSFPTTHHDVDPWWAAVKSQVVVEVAAQAGALVQRILDALLEPVSVRQERRLASAWSELQALAPRLVDTSPPQALADPMTRVDAWAASASGELWALRQRIEGTPQAIAIRFLNALKEDVSAWAAIVDRHAGAVAATCSMAARAELDPGEVYDWVVIDEAGRASPFELLIPMVQGRRVVLIGDHRQLPPTVDEALARRSTDVDRPAADIRFDTLFGLLFRLLPPGARERLSTQYRMHGVIGGLVDEIFYRPHGEPLASAFAGERAIERQVPWDVFERRPCVWVDVAASGAPCTEENPREADAVIELLKRYRDAGAIAGDHGAPIAVICPYTRQRERIKRAVEGDPSLVSIVQVKTIDAVQGREYPVVVLCLVRTDGRPGFLTSPNRLNVAISRAQRQLVVVGSSQRFLGSAIVRTSAPELHSLIKRLAALTRETA